MAFEGENSAGFFIKNSAEVIHKERVTSFRLHEGDVLFLPSNYPHKVTTRGATVTLNWGFKCGALENPLYSQNRESELNQHFAMYI